MKKISYSDGSVLVLPQKLDAHFSEGYDKDHTDKIGRGRYFFQLDVTAEKETVYIPVSIASGRQSTGFIYQIEGTDEAKGSASINGRGDGVTTVTSGSIIYFKIPPGKTVSYRIVIEVTGKLRGEYRAVISRVNYKFNTNEPRYRRFVVEIGTKSVKFK